MARKRVAVGDTCVKGHTVTDDTIIYYKNGTTVCRICDYNNRAKKSGQPELSEEEYRKRPILKSGRRVRNYLGGTCAAGHTLTADNIRYTGPNGDAISCLTCSNQKTRASRIEGLYNISLTQYDTMLLLQNNCCAVCSKEFVDTPHVDHDHSCCSGKTSCGKCVRGLLCSRCNVGLGSFEDNIEYLKQAIAYLENS